MAGNKRIYAMTAPIVVSLLIAIATLICFTTMAYATSSTDPSSNSENLRCARVLAEVQNLKGEAESAIERNDIEGLGKLHSKIRTKVRDAHLKMDHAFLVGAWKPAEYKQDAADIMGRLEGVEILNFISLAFLNGYDHPSKKMPPSVTDATRKMFVHLKSVTDRLEILNKSVENKK